MINILFAAKAERWDTYERPLLDALSDAGIKAHLATDIPAADVDYIVYAPNSDVQDFTPYTRAKAVLNLWAGVENVVWNETLQVPLCRMVDPGMTQSMVEWVTGHVLRHHLGMDAHIHNPSQDWSPKAPPLAEERRVTVFGLGELGRSAATTLRSLGFDVAGWSRRPKDLNGIMCFDGPDGLNEALALTDIAILLLPDTPGTENTFDAAALAQMPKGAVIINPGRGPLIDDDALIDALSSGQIGHATLDVFRVEPLPKNHPFWAHPGVTVTPHIAAETRPRTASRVIVENIRRAEDGEPLLYVVDRDLGY
jgi:glyoxylate/hydroxypyruvate reductase A